MKLKKTDLKEISDLLDQIHKIDLTTSSLHKLSRDIVNDNNTITIDIGYVVKNGDHDDDMDAQVLSHPILGRIQMVTLGGSHDNRLSSETINMSLDDTDALEMIGCMIQIHQTKRDRLMVKLEAFGFKK